MKRTSILVCLLLSFLFLWILLPDPKTEAQVEIPEGFTGISDRAGLESISAVPDGKYILMNDISLSGSDWRALCSQEYPFTGVFDGNGYTIYGMAVSDTENACGLFSYIGSGGKVKSLSVRGEASGPIAGLIAGWISGGTIENCTVEGTVNSSFFGGGIAGRIYGSSVTVTGCISKATLSGTGSAEGELCLGGICGAVYGRGQVLADCEFSGELKPSGTNFSVGGIAGVLDEGEDGVITLSGNRSKGTLSLSVIETAYAGGIAGRIGSRNDKIKGTITISKCTFSGDWAGSGCGGVLFLGGIVGRAEVFGEITLTQCSAEGTLSGTGHPDFSNPDGTGSRCTSCGVPLGYVETQNSGTVVVQKDFNVNYSAFAGGILGEGISDGGTLNISQCSSYVSLNGAGGPLFLGGISGMNRVVNGGTTVIQDCFSGGRITDASPVHGELASAHGGIVGFLGGNGTATLQRCFSACELFVDYPLCDGAVAGLVSPYFGETAAITVTACYALFGVRDAYGVGLSGGQVSDPAVYEGFDFDSVWKIDPISGMPNLKESAFWVESSPLGDVDGNGKITRYDAVLLSQYLTGNASLTQAQLQRADYDGNGVWNAMDISAILRSAS